MRIRTCFELGGNPHPHLLDQVQVLDETSPLHGAIFQLSESKLTPLEMARELSHYGPVNHPVLTSSGESLENEALEAWLRWCCG